MRLVHLKGQLLEMDGQIDRGDGHVRRNLDTHRCEVEDAADPRCDHFLGHPSVDAAMSVLSIHHWAPHAEAGVREMRRVARDRVVILTIDAEVCGEMWLMAEYLHEVAELDRRIFPPINVLRGWLGSRARVVVVPIPADTCDWTLMSFWAHPERVLDPDARAATSGFARMSPQVVDRVVQAVGDDLRSGTWDDRHGELRRAVELDVGLRLLVG